MIARAHAITLVKHIPDFKLFSLKRPPGGSYRSLAFLGAKAHYQGSQAQTLQSRRLFTKHQGNLLLVERPCSVRDSLTLSDSDCLHHLIRRLWPM